MANPAKVKAAPIRVADLRVGDEVYIFGYWWRVVRIDDRGAWHLDGLGAAAGQSAVSMNSHPERARRPRG